jgi:hypothetical protein
MYLWCYAVVCMILCRTSLHVLVAGALLRASLLQAGMEGVAQSRVPRVPADTQEGCRQQQQRNLSSTGCGAAHLHHSSKQDMLCCQTPWSGVLGLRQAQQHSRSSISEGTPS